MEVVRTVAFLARVCYFPSEGCLLLSKGYSFLVGNDGTGKGHMAYKMPRQRKTKKRKKGKVDRELQSKYPSMLIASCLS